LVLERGLGGHALSARGGGAAAAPSPTPSHIAVIFNSISLVSAPMTVEEICVCLGVLIRTGYKFSSPSRSVEVP
jgi:hypothetical protein